MYQFIDTGRVIEEVRSRPILWDPAHILNKDRDARTLSWIEVYEALYHDYNDMEDYRKRDLGKLVQQRWKTARDAFIRSKNQQKAGKHKKKYVFFDEMMFLDKIHHTAETSATPDFVECVYDSNPPQLTYQEVKVEPADEEVKVEPADEESRLEPQVEEYELEGPEIWEAQVMEPSSLESQDQDALDSLVSNSPTKTGPGPSKRIPRKRKITNSNSNPHKEMMTMFKDNSKLLKNDDLAFCMSLLPITVEFTVEQKLSFRMQVLRKAMEMTSQQEDGSDSEDSFIM